MVKKIAIFLITSICVMAESIPMTPLIPAAPVTKEENVNGVIKKRRLLITDSVEARVKAQVIVPLEVISDVDIKALVIDDQEVTVPFQLELNKKPDRENFYKINFSQKEIDIDKDGRIDTTIYVNEKINSKIIKDNYVKIEGKNISKEGTHRKKVYITVEVDD